MSLSTHVLDAVTGTPAAGVPVQLADAAGAPVAAAVTDRDGRVRELAASLPVGVYRLRFDVASYDPAAFFPEVVVAFTVTDPGAHLHVPLLLSPFAYSTYRGS